MENPQLTMTTPDGRGYCNMRHIDINQPAQGLEEDFPITTAMKERKEEDGKIVEAAAEHCRPIRPKKLQLDGEQCWLLEESFRLNPTPNPKQKEELAMKLKLRPRQVEVWFQNRRARCVFDSFIKLVDATIRTKLKQIEIECEYLRCCFSSLSAENRRLQREVEQLRAHRAGPPTILLPQSLHPVPASSLTMCPQCQHITTAATADSGGSRRRIPKSA